MLYLIILLVKQIKKCVAFLSSFSSALLSLSPCISTLIFLFPSCLWRLGPHEELYKNKLPNAGCRKGFAI
jgi:hypothetical protein